MPQWDNYTQKSTPEDSDTLMIKDTTAGANKRTPFSGVWNWIVTKLANAVISQLETSNKTVIGSLNELNSKSDNKIQFNEIEVSIDTKINEIYSTNGAIDISNAFPSAKRIIALGGRSPGSNYVCNATVEGNAVLYCNAKYSGSYKVLLIGIY